MEFLASLIAVLIFLHILFTSILRRGMNTKNEKVWLGGLILNRGVTGHFLATWPLALLYVKEGKLVIGYTAIFKKEYTFTSSDIVSISPAWVFPFIGKVICINHVNPDYHEKIYFASWPFTSKYVSNEINRIFTKREP